jgi:predicted metal-dependent phosphoesterase TrpH
MKNTSLSNRVLAPFGGGYGRLLMRRAVALLVLVAFTVSAFAVTPPPAHSHALDLDIAARHLAYGPVRRPRTLRLSPGEVAIDTHVHTEYSPDSKARVRDVLLQAVHRGLTAIAITDHNTMAALPKARTELAKLRSEGRAPAGFFLIPGEEISSSDGHIVALYISQAIPAGLTAIQTIVRIHSQGGLAIAAHPMFRDSLGTLAITLPFDGVETMNGAEEAEFVVAKAAARERRTKFYTLVRAPRFGGSDAHDARLVGICYTVLPDCNSDPNSVKQALYGGRTEAGQAPSVMARVRGVFRGARWLTWDAHALPGTDKRDITPMLRVPLQRGSLTLKLDSGTGVLFRRAF